MNKCKSNEARSAPFSSTSHAPFCASLYRSISASLGAIPGVLSGALCIVSSSQPQTHLLLMFSLFCASLVALKLSLLLFF